MAKRFNLVLFGEGGDGGASTGTAASAQGMAESGIASTSAEGSNDGLANQEETFDSLIGKNGRYEADFNNRVQSVVKDRLKNSKAQIDGLNATLAKLQPALELLGTKYGVDATNLESLDVENLVKQITEDDSYYEEEALEKGIPVETLKELKKAQKESAQAKKALEEVERRNKDQEAIAQLISQEQQLKTVYPNFDLRTEMDNPTFGRMVASGVSVRDAYEFAHRHELQPAAMGIVANTVQQKLVNSIAAGTARPAENGMSATAASLSKTDPRNLTSAELKDIRERVRRGEKITW